MTKSKSNNTKGSQTKKSPKKRCVSYGRLSELSETIDDDEDRKFHMDFNQTEEELNEDSPDRSKMNSQKFW